MTAQHLANVEPLRRTALLMAGIADLEIRLTDAVLAMFCKYMGSLFTKARGRDERRFQTTKRDVARTLRLFRRTITALKQAKETGEDGVAVVEREVGLAKLDQALPVIEAVADVADVEILATAAEKYAVLRRFSPRSWPRSGFSPARRRIPFSLLSTCSKRRTRTAPVPFLSGCRRRSCHRNGAG